jgi:hypothetical protein
MGAQLQGTQRGTREGTRRLQMERLGTRTLIVRDHRRTGWSSRLPQRSDGVEWSSGPDARARSLDVAESVGWHVWFVVADHVWG